MQVFEEALNLANYTDLSETGGSHSQKGMEYQKHWAVSQMFKLFTENEDDFLILFEALQDIAVYNSSSNPKSVKIYQIKKKDRNEWKWNLLTGLHKENSKKQPYDKAPHSVLGKLYHATISVKSLGASGHFVSNAGCDLELNCGGNAATSTICTLEDLNPPYLDLLREGLKTLHEDKKELPKFDNIYIEKSSIPVDEPKKFLIGEVYEFLKSKSPAHVNQTESLIDALLIKISPLGAKTDKCKNFEELKKRQGFSRQEFGQALADLETIPDKLQVLTEILSQLKTDGMIFYESIAVKKAATEIQRKQLLNMLDEDSLNLLRLCDDWIEKHSLNGNLMTVFDNAYKDIVKSEHNITKSTFFALFALRTIDHAWT